MVHPVTYDMHHDPGAFTPGNSLEAPNVSDLPTAGDVADCVGCAHRTALGHLNRFGEEGVTSRTAGRAKLRTLAEDGEDG
jgi:hypothetical protein